MAFAVTWEKKRSFASRNRSRRGGNFARRAITPCFALWHSVLRLRPAFRAVISGYPSSLAADTLTGLFADFGELGGGFLDGKAPIDGRHAPGKVRHAPVGAAAVTVGGAPASDGIVRPYLVRIADCWPVMTCGVLAVNAGAVISGSGVATSPFASTGLSSRCGQGGRADPHGREIRFVFAFVVDRACYAGSARSGMIGPCPFTEPAGEVFGFLRVVNPETAIHAW